MLINLVPMLIEQGMSRNLAAVALGLGGVGQVLGRLGYARFAAATSVRMRTVSVMAAIGVATAALALAPAVAVAAHRARAWSSVWPAASTPSSRPPPSPTAGDQPATAA